MNHTLKSLLVSSVLSLSTSFGSELSYCDDTSASIQKGQSAELKDQVRCTVSFVQLPIEVHFNIIPPIHNRTSLPLLRQGSLLNLDALVKLAGASRRFNSLIQPVIDAAKIWRDSNPIFRLLTNNLTEEDVYMLHLFGHNSSMDVFKTTVNLLIDKRIKKFEINMLLYPSHFPQQRLIIANLSSDEVYEQMLAATDLNIYDMHEQRMKIFFKILGDKNADFKNKLDAALALEKLGNVQPLLKFLTETSENPTTSSELLDDISYYLIRNNCFEPLLKAYNRIAKFEKSTDGELSFKMSDKLFSLKKEYFQYISTLSYNGSTEKVVQSLCSLVDTDFLDCDLSIKIAHKLVELDQKESASIVYAKIAADEELPLNLRFQMGVLLAYLGKSEIALRVFHNLISNQTISPAMIKEIADRIYQFSWHEDAVLAYSQVVKHPTSSFEQIFYASKAIGAIGDKQRAKRYFIELADKRDVPHSLTMQIAFELVRLNAEQEVVMELIGRVPEELRRFNY
jgi:hypothetical protein